MAVLAIGLATVSLQNQHHRTPLPLRIFLLIAAQVVLYWRVEFSIFKRPFTSTSLYVYHKNYLNVVNRLIAFKWFLTVTWCIILIPSQQPGSTDMANCSKYSSYINAILACSFACLLATRTFKPGAMCLLDSHYRMKKRADRTRLLCY